MQGSFFQEIFDSLSVFMSQNFMGDSLGLWIIFFAIVITLMVFDLGVLNRKDTVIDPKTSLLYSAFYMFLAFLFGGWLWSQKGPDDGMDYFTAYMVELSLSLDNLFVMSVILAYFNVPRHYQHRVLFWGILGVLIMRGGMIAAGVVIIQSFSWALYIFAGFLLVTGVKMLFMKDGEDDKIEDSFLIRFLTKKLRFTKEINGHKFFLKLPDHKTHKMVWFATPLFMALICIEFMDVLFALDSVPAVFAITNEPFVIYTSNIFAILGLRSMYFAVAAMIDRFKYMKYALAIVLIFISGKVFYVGIMDQHIHPMVSLGITLSVLAGGIVFSMFKTRNET